MDLMGFIEAAQLAFLYASFDPWHLVPLRLDGRDYCMGGSGLLGFKTVSRRGTAFSRLCFLSHLDKRGGGAFPLVVQTFVET